MRWFLVLITVLACGRHSEAPGESRITKSEPSAQWVFINDPLKWESDPPDLGKNYDNAQGEIILLGKDRSFSRLRATLFRDKGRSELQLCLGCGHSVLKGRWTRVEGQQVFLAESRWTYRQTPLPQPRPEWDVVEKWSFQGEMAETGPAALERDGVRFVPLAQLESLDTLAQLLAAEDPEL
jgi:hypothetical protein